jgi:hypothetical protein
MFSSKRIKELELRVTVLERENKNLSEKIERLSYIYVYTNDLRSCNSVRLFPVKDAIMQLLNSLGLKIVYKRAKDESFALEKREGEEEVEKK